MKEKERNEKLENLIDSESLGLVLDSLANVCHEKAQHVQTFWQDEILAGKWERAAIQIEKTIDQLCKREINL